MIDWLIKAVYPAVQHEAAHQDAQDRAHGGPAAVHRTGEPPRYIRVESPRYVRVESRLRSRYICVESYPGVSSVWDPARLLAETPLRIPYVQEPRRRYIQELRRRYIQELRRCYIQELRRCYIQEPLRILPDPAARIGCHRIYNRCFPHIRLAIALPREHVSLRSDF